MTEREFAIQKGEIAKKFSEEFFSKYYHDPLTRSIYEILIRNDNPYQIIEDLVKINGELIKKLYKEVTDGTN